MKYKLLCFSCACILFGCVQKKHKRIAGTGASFTVMQIDSLAEILDNHAQEQLGHENRKVIEFVLSDSLKNQEMKFEKDSSLKLITHFEKLTKRSSSVIKYYFKNQQLIKASFAIAESLRGTNLGEYYYSHNSLLKNTVTTEMVASPETILEHAKKHISQE